MHWLPLAHLVILGLAAARITSLVVFDGITEPIRHRIFLLSPPVAAGDDSGLAFYAVVDRHGLPLDGVERGRGWFGQLVSCYHCTGVWVSTGVVVTYELWPHTVGPVLLVAAVAQLSDLFTKGSRDDA